MRSAQDLFAELNAVDESNRIEAKRAPESPHGEVPAGGDLAPSMWGLSKSPHAGDGIPPELQARIRAEGLLALKHHEARKHSHQAYPTVADEERKNNKEPGREA